MNAAMDGLPIAPLTCSLVVFRRETWDPYRIRLISSVGVQSHLQGARAVLDPTASLRDCWHVPTSADLLRLICSLRSVYRREDAVKLTFQPGGHVSSVDDLERAAADEAARVSSAVQAAEHASAAAIEAERRVSAAALAAARADYDKLLAEKERLAGQVSRLSALVVEKDIKYVDELARVCSEGAAATATVASARDSALAAVAARDAALADRDMRLADTVHGPALPVHDRPPSVISPGHADAIGTIELPGNAERLTPLPWVMYSSPVAATCASDEPAMVCAAATPGVSYIDTAGHAPYFYGGHVRVQPRASGAHVVHGTCFSTFTVVACQPLSVQLAVYDRAAAPHVPLAERRRRMFLMTHGDHVILHPGFYYQLSNLSPSVVAVVSVAKFRAPSECWFPRR
jgi:hypothetical protein